MILNSDSLKITPEILLLIAEMDEFKGVWRALGTLTPECLSALHRVATIESIGSSTRIEGSKLSDKEISCLLMNLEIRKFETRDEQEVAGYAKVMETVFAHADELTVTENHVRQLHRDLLIYSDKDTWHRGICKINSSNVTAFNADGKKIGVVFENATPFDAPRRITELVEWTRTTLDENRLHPLLAIAILAAAFLQIHLFQDGNGRLSRILTTLLLLRSGYEYVSYGSLESVIEQTKENYYVALRKTQGTIRCTEPDWQPWRHVSCVPFSDKRGSSRRKSNTSAS